MIAACLTLGVVHLYVWHKQRSEYGSLLFFALAVAAASVGAFELSMMRADTPQAYATALRWAHVPLAVGILALVGFVRFYLGAGRDWLAYVVSGLRLVALALNFATGVNLNFEGITRLDHVRLWGGPVLSLPVGSLNPWWAVGQIDTLLLVAFIVDASIALWRRGGTDSRRRALALGGGLTLCVVFILSVSVLVFSRHLRTPTVVTPAFFIVVLAMGYELGHDVLRAAQLAGDLRESQRRLDLAAQAAGLALWSWNVASNDFWMNSSGRVLFDLSQAERVDLGVFLARVHPNDRDLVRRTMEETVHKGGYFETEFRMSTRDSQVRWIATRGQVEVRRSGALLRGVTFDISERVRAEHETAEQRKELTHLARVASLGEMAGSLAHEINQPLMAILSNARAAQRFMALENADLVEVRAILADIVADDQRAGEVINRLRALLRKGEVQRGPFDLNDIAADVLRLTRNELLNRGVAVSVELAPNLPSTLGDRIQVQQVLLNLVMNACDAMEGVSGSRQLVVRTRIADGAAVEVSISDSGRGIPPADLERIFEPFVTTKERGLGLGLSVCRTIVAAHGGRLWAESVDGRGATLRVKLPTPGAGHE